MSCQEILNMKIIQHHLNFRPDADWIVSQSGLPYLGLNIDAPYNDIYREWLDVKYLAVKHRAEESISEKFFYGHSGWTSLVIYGKHSTATSDNEKPFAWTDIANLCPITKSWIDETFVIDESTNRIRFMNLDPGGYILPHVDRTEKKFSEVNVAIKQPSGCVFRFTHYGTVPFQDGSANLVDISNQHMVVNNSTEPRLHIIAHARLRNKKLIEEGYESRYYS